MSSPPHCKLLVEGATDERVIPYLMESNGVDWGSRDDPVVLIKPYNGVEELLKPGVVEAELLDSGLKALGVMVDANGDASDRWNRIKALCDKQFKNLPNGIPQNGLDTVHPETGARFGVWIMPDNRFSGMLEDFLIRLIPENSRGLYELAEKCVDEAARSGAPFKNVHEAKAKIYTWLAWQDEPGKQLHEAVHHRPYWTGPRKARVATVRQLVQTSLRRVDHQAPFRVIPTRAAHPLAPADPVLGDAPATRRVPSATRGNARRSGDRRGGYGDGIRWDRMHRPRQPGASAIRAGRWPHRPGAEVCVRR